MDRAEPARGRLAVLSAHLLGAGAGEADVAPGLERAPVSAAQAAPPGPRAGALAVVDARTGTRYEVKVSEEATVRATDLKKVTISLAVLVTGSSGGLRCDLCCPWGAWGSGVRLR